MSQSAVILPGSPLSGGTMIGDINATAASIISAFSGSVAPTLGPGAGGSLVVGQYWLNTGVTPNILSMFDGTTWAPVANIDPTFHTYSTISDPLSWRNVVDNGGMEVWQRGAGSSASIAVGASTTAYTVERWYLLTQANQASVVAAVAGLTSQSNLAAKITRNNGQTGVGQIDFAYPLDTDEIVRMRGQKVSFSFVAKAGANWSPASGTLFVQVFVGTGAVGKRGNTPYASETVIMSTNINLATSAQGVIAVPGSVTVPTNATQAEVTFFWTPVGTAGADDSVIIDDVQLETGVFASTFERMPFDVVLQKCKRHFWKTFLYGTAPAQNVGVNTGEIQETVGKAGATVLADNIVIRHPLSMRGTPAITTFNPRANNAQVARESGGSSPADQTATATLNVTSETTTITATGDAAGAVGDLIGVHITADAGI